jgi:hypothetical protein
MGWRGSVSGSVSGRMGTSNTHIHTYIHKSRPHRPCTRTYTSHVNTDLAHAHTQVTSTQTLRREIRKREGEEAANEKKKLGQQTHQHLRSAVFYLNEYLFCFEWSAQHVFVDVIDNWAELYCTDHCTDTAPLIIRPLIIR